MLEKKARAYGSFRRPHLFEIKENETVRDLFYFAGGITSEAKIDGKFELTRLNKDSIQVKEFSSKDQSLLSLELKDGDSVSARSLSSLDGGVIELNLDVNHMEFSINESVLKTIVIQNDKEISKETISSELAFI